MAKLTFLVCSWSPETSASVVEQLCATERVSVTATVSDLFALGDALKGRRVDGIYFDLDLEPAAALEFVAAMPKPRPIILLGAAQGDSDLLLRAMRLGARDFFLGHELTGLKSLLKDSAPPLSPSERVAPTLAVVGAKGGVGATTVACELGVALQESGLNTIVCDLSRRLGDVAIYFDLEPRFDISDFLRHEGELDAVFMDAVVDNHRSDVSVLAAASRLEDVTLLSSPKLERILKFLQIEYDCILLDVPWDFDEFSLRALDMSNEIVLVTAPDVAALTHTRMQREVLESLGTLAERVHVVLNRADPDASIDEKQVTDYLACELDAVIRNFPVTARKRADEGRILREVLEGDAMRAEIQLLRDRICEWCEFDPPMPDEPVAQGRFMTRLRSLFRRS